MGYFFPGRISKSLLHLRRDFICKTKRHEKRQLTNFNVSCEMHQLKRSCFVLRWKPPSLHIGDIDHLYIVDNKIITAGAAKYKLFMMKWLQLDTDVMKYNILLIPLKPNSKHLHQT